MTNENETPPPSPSDRQADPPGDHRHAPPNTRLSSQPLAQDGKRGSLWAGFGWFWVIAVCATWVSCATWVPFVVGVKSSTGSAAGITGALLALAPLLLGIWLAIRGRKRTALGVLLGYASAAALVLLLYSVCAGLFALSR
jgi:hypothetical protein